MSSSPLKLSASGRRSDSNLEHCIYLFIESLLLGRVLQTASNRENRVHFLYIMVIWFKCLNEEFA